MFKGSLGGEFELSSTSDESEDEPAVPSKKHDLVKSVINKIEEEKSDIGTEESLEREVSSTSSTVHDLTPRKTSKPTKKSRKGKVIKEPIVPPQHSSLVTAETKVQQESKLYKAIKKGDIDAAISITDSLCDKDSEEQIENFVRAREYLEEKQKKEQTKISRKRKKLAWTFESKKRWETKSNM